MFKALVYSKTEEEFLEKQEEFEQDALRQKYPQYWDHIRKSYGGRIESWALYVRIQKKLPTHGSNTTAYAEASMKMTKETQFGRMKTRNLHGLLCVMCDQSSFYMDKLIEVGNNRTAHLRNAKSKYAEQQIKITKNQILDLGDGKFMVQSHLNENKWYTCDIKSGFCECPVGVNSAPCWHKGAVAKYFNVAEFNVIPSFDPYQCAMYHFLATGTTLPAHMYRQRGQSDVPNIDQYIKEKLANIQTTFEPDQSVIADDPALIEAGDKAFEDDQYNEDAEVMEQEHEDEQRIKDNFKRAMEEYTNKVLEMHDNDPKDKKTIAAMKVMTGRLKKSLKCSNPTIHTQMHKFGKGSGADRVCSSSLVIKPNPPGIAARMAPGSGPAPQGRKPKDRSGELLVAPSASGDPVIVARSDRPHDISYITDSNLPGAS